jgi:predicted enzyme related to lactoylglutathione lyase
MSRAYDPASAHNPCEEQPMGNPFVHIELSTPDVAKAKAFYGKLFDWKLEDMPMGPDEVYTMIGVGEGTGGGMMHTPPGAPPGWYAYVNVDDISATTKKAKDLGAQVMKDVTEIPNVGWFSFVVDPTGCAIAMFQPKPKQ